MVDPSREASDGWADTVQPLAWFVRAASGRCHGPRAGTLAAGMTPAPGDAMTTRVGMTLILVAVASLPARAAPDVCGQTARAARHACANATRDDYWTAVGICTNTTDAAARSACRRTAKQDAKDAAKGCNDQFAARKDLCDAPGPSAYAPAIDPGRFLDPATTAARPNPLFPLKPGTTWTYVGGGETDTVTVTNGTRLIDGVTCIVVRDTVNKGGGATEDTEDFFAQDVDGNVWYFGELSQGFENGELTSLEGSWRAGVDGASPGMIMKAMPAFGDTYRQEFAFGTAEDAAEVLTITGSATVPAVSCSGTCLVTREFSPLEPDADEQKYYAPGIGMILEVESNTGARNELVSFEGG